MGFAYLDELVNNQWKTITTFSGSDQKGVITDPKYFLHPQAPKRIRTTRTGNCSRCFKIL
ncbi:hypothetical protein [Chryseobacterium wanjuense]